MASPKRLALQNEVSHPDELLLVLFCRYKHVVLFS